RAAPAAPRAGRLDGPSFVCGGRLDGPSSFRGDRDPLAIAAAFRIAAVASHAWKARARPGADMTVAVYKLRIRADTGDDGHWQDARVVAASLAEALVQAQQRFGEDRVMAIAQDANGGVPTEADLAAAALEAPAHAAVVPEPLPDPQIVHSGNPDP